MNTAQLYNQADLVGPLRVQFPAAGSPIIMNNRYCAATRAWVEQRFSNYFWNFEIARGQLTYKTRGNQCEHYALRAALEVVDLLRQMQDSQIPEDAESLAVACCKFLKGAGTDAAAWHEVNLWFFEGAWFPWEPQLRAFFEFTEAERLSVQQVLIP